MPRGRQPWDLLAGLVALALTVACSAPGPPPSSTLIRAASLVDGSGAAARTTSVRIDGERVVAIGELVALAGERVIETEGLVLAPGFIDTHSHHDFGLADAPDALAAVSQGITTIVVGADGAILTAPVVELFAALEERPAAVNLASYSGHNRLRREVLGEDFRRPATAAELEKMTALLAAELEAGALGLSTGLEYEPGIYSTTEEVVALAKVAAAAGGRYSSHLRSEDRWLLEAIEEILHIGATARLPVHISHFKLAMKNLWGRADELLARLDRARAEGIDVTADLYPYEYWQSTLLVILPQRDLSDRGAIQFALEEIAPGAWLGDYRPDPALAGRSIADIAMSRGEDEVTTYVSLVEESQRWEVEHDEATGTGASLLAASMHRDDIDVVLRWPHTNLCSDGGLESAHARGRGAYPRILGRFVRERGVLTLEAAIHKATRLAAEHVGLTDRGFVREGGWADLVLFDPQRIIDRATPEEPFLVSEGIARVWVNGEEVFRDGTATGARPGRVLRRGE